uniref:Uncharacterized protein n=2 Tax=Avena sativa TaxID=4498 RepID=A0ACD5VEX2_AVESA
MEDADLLRILSREDKPRDLPLALLKEITNDFSEERSIGHGGYGDVYKGVKRTDENTVLYTVAVKRIRDFDDKLFRAEVTSLMSIEHQNIVRILGFCSNTHVKWHKHPKSGENDLVNVNERLLCLEYIRNGSLDNYISDELNGLKWETRYEIITGICEGMRYLHEVKKIIHMDLKPGNILLDGKNMVPKITDFGLSRPNKATHTMALPIGTSGYIAPEYMAKRKTTFACDIYSLGTIITELVTGSMDVPNRHNVLQRWRHRWSEPLIDAPYRKNRWSEPPMQLRYQQVTTCMEIAGRCRVENPEARRSILEIISTLREPGSTYGQAEQTKLVGSASGKGKHDRSENAEATSMDINSNAQRQCNLHPLQSFSRHSPTNGKYLGKKSPAVDHARGAMGSLLDKLGKLVTEDYSLGTSIESDIDSFSVQLKKIDLELPKLEKVDGVEVLVDEVRDLSYKIEDMVDSFRVHVEPDSNRSGFIELRKEGLKLWENGMISHRQIGEVIRDIKNQVQAVVERKEKYNFSVNDVVDNATAKATIEGIRISAITVGIESLTGIEAPRDELISLFEEDANLSKQNLKIVSIVGHGGSGKTTLANAVYDKLQQAQCHPKAIVPLGRKPVVNNVLKKLISVFETDFNPVNKEAWELCLKLKELLKNKRYIIFIDDIWNTSDWEAIKPAFPENKHGSRVITTTRIHDVALACCNAERKYVYSIKPLNEVDSGRLFFGIIFGPGKDCPDNLKTMSERILKRCDGMPLAIKSIASFLAGKPEATWKYVWDYLGPVIYGNEDLENMKQILDLSYIHLPDDLKTCLLYVCKYPEDREIEKDDLVRQWVAEGFVSSTGGLDAEDVAENYFKTLINMCMIQPGKIDYHDDEVLSCRVHDIILELMRYKSRIENFIHVTDGLKDVSGQICRVSVHCNVKKDYNDDDDDDDSNMLEKIKGSLKHVRSVLLHQGSHLPYFLEFKYVRVLHLEYEKSGSNWPDLTGISRLVLLRYLKIVIGRFSGGQLKLPARIGELQQLETIDLEGGNLKRFPSDIVSLPRLTHLRYGGTEGVALPGGMDLLKSLRTLEGVCVYRSSVRNIKRLGYLTSLRKLQTSSYWIGQSDEKIIPRMNALLCSVLKLSTSLRILNVGSESRYRPHVFQKDPASGGILTAKRHIIRKLDLSGCIFQSCPEWIGRFQDLYSLRIEVRQVANGVTVVGGLPSLVYLYLSTSIMGEEEKEERVVMSGGGGAFKALKHLIFRCQKASLTFEEGALPKLEKLQLRFRYHMTPRCLPAGIENLPASTLEEISLGISTGKCWVDDDMDSYSMSAETREKSRKRIAKLSAMLKGAFKPHHPDADIYTYMEDRGNEEVGPMKDNIAAEGVRDEEVYEEDADDKEDDYQEYDDCEEDEEGPADEIACSTEEDGDEEDTRTDEEDVDSDEESSFRVP